MTLEEILSEMYFPGGNIEVMAGDRIPNGQEDKDRKPSEERAKSMNARKMNIRKRIRRTKKRNKPWTREQELDASPKASEHDLGQTDAAMHGIMRGSHPYPGNQGI